MFRQQNPYCVQIEPTTGCNLRCGFCGIRGIREKSSAPDLSGPYEFMEVMLAHSIAEQMKEAGWTSRIEIAMHGEPTVHPRLPEIVEAFRKRLSNHIMITTNGIPMLEGRPDWGTSSLHQSVMTLFGAGANTVAVDDYAPHRVAPALRQQLWPMPLYEYPSDSRGHPHHRIKTRRLVIVADIAQASEGSHANLLNHCGSAAPKEYSHNHQVCSLPFREIAVRSNGDIAMCCNDWRGEYRWGDAHDMVGAWHSQAAYAARRVLLSEGRAPLAPCNGCDYVAVRPGFLPNQSGRGKKEIGLPTDVDYKAIEMAQAHGTMTPVVLRRWERGEAVA